MRAADAAPPVVPEEADPGGADVAVAAPADGHPLDGLRAHAAAPGLGVVDHDGVAFLGIACRPCRRRTRLAATRRAHALHVCTPSVRTFRPAHRALRRAEADRSGPGAGGVEGARQPWCPEQERGKHRQVDRRRDSDGAAMETLLTSCGAGEQRSFRASLRSASVAAGDHRLQTSWEQSKQPAGQQEHRTQYAPNLTSYIPG